jgi:hypothetical protein
VVDSEVISSAIKSDGARKRFPRLGEMVRVINRQGLFVVLQVDRERCVAELMKLVGKVEVVDSGVPLHHIRSLSGDASKAVQAFLNTGQVPKSVPAPAGAGPIEVPNTNPQKNRRSESVPDAPAA